MGIEWEVIELEQLIEPERGISYGIVQPGTHIDDGVPIIRVSDIKDGQIFTSNPLRVSPDIELKYLRTRLRGGELLLTLVGTVGEAAIVPESLSGWNTARAIAVIPIKKDIGSYWVKLALKSPLVQQIIKSRLNTTVQATLNLSDVAKLPIVLPSQPEREAIIKILYTLDERIELNRKMNETLEAMARAIFKSWFVYFDPVRAKMECRDTRLPKEIVNLFPDSFENSDIGEIPRGWVVASFGDLVIQRTERINSREAVVLSAVANGNLVRSDEHFNKRVYSKEIGKYLAVEQWDFAYNPSRINIGSIGMLEEPILGAVSPVYVVFRPKSNYRWYLEFNLRFDSTREWINTLASGSVRQSLSYSDFRSIPCVIPPEKVINSFDEIWTSMRQGMLSRDKETCTLIALRDALLPKLISGEIRVKDAEQFFTRGVL